MAKPVVVNEFFNNSEYSDITILLNNGDKILAHKLILSKISPILKAIINSDMKEASENIIRFPEHSDNSVINTIKYIYGIVVKDVNITEIVNIMYFAHYLQLPKLVNLMIKFHSKSIDRGELVNVAYLLDNYKLLRVVIERCISDRNIINDYVINEFKPLTEAAFNWMFENWNKQICSPGLLLKAICFYYKSHNIDCDVAATEILKIIHKIDLTLTISVNKNFIYLDLPIIKDNQTLNHIFKTMKELREGKLKA